MQSTGAMASLISVLLAELMWSSSAVLVSVSPVQQVLKMLTDMKTKGEQDMKAEKVTFDEYTSWMQKSVTTLEYNLKTAGESIEQTQAFIAKTDNDISQLTDKITTLDGKMDELQEQKATATEVRTEESQKFQKNEQDLAETVDDLNRALQELKTQEAAASVKGQALIQRTATSDRGTLLSASFEDSLEAPSADAYKSEVGGTTAVLTKLQDKFEKELTVDQQEEAKKDNAYKLEMTQLDGTLKEMDADHDARAEMKATKKVESTKAQTKLVNTKGNLEEDKKTLADLKATYAAKKAAFEENQKIRKDELAAISKAIEIISSPAVAKSYASNLALTQVRTRSLSLLQLGRRSGTSKHQSAQLRVANVLQNRGRALSSKVLLSAAEMVRADPYAKVTKMIKTLLANLKAQAGAGTDRKAWCDEQTKSNKLVRERKESQLAKVDSEIEAITASISSMTEQAEALAAEIAELTKSMSAATKQRGKEKAENAATIADAKAGADTTKQALKVLREFYSSQAGLLQQDSSQAPDIEKYGGMQGAKTGVVGMLEVIESDFRRLMTETKASEEQAASEYDNFMKDSEANKSTKEKAEKQLKLDKDNSEFNKGRMIPDKKSIQKQLDKANEYFGTLQSSCGDVKATYEQRVAARKEEVEALQDAYKMLDAMR